MTIHIDTERLVLRDLRLTDLEDMFALDSDPEVHTYLGNKPVKHIDESKKILTSVLKQYQERGVGRFAIIEKQSGNFVGWSGIRLNTEHSMNGFSNYYDVGFRLLKRFWGKGFAIESGKASVEYAFNSMKLPEIYATTEIGNEASHHALLKIGLHYKETFYSAEEQTNLRWYALTIQEFRKAKKKEYAKKYYAKNKARILEKSKKQYHNDTDYKERIKTIYRTKYQENDTYKKDTLNRAKKRYHEDEDYRDKTIKRSRARNKKQ